MGGRREVLPLLDGLDEVAETHRAGCVGAVNDFCQEHGPLQIAVCSRTEEYRALATRLRMEEALELQPPTRQQVSAYLEAAGAALTDVQAALDADETLWEFLQSPLVLNVVALTYQDRPADALRAAGTPEQRLALLFAAYTTRMFDHRPGRYTPPRMLHWLAWLAHSMRERNQIEFHLDRLQPDWLPTKTQQRLVLLAPMIGVGLAFGLVVGPAFRLVFGLGSGLVDGLGGGLIAVLAAVLGDGLVAMLAAVLVAMLAAVVVAERAMPNEGDSPIGAPRTCRRAELRWTCLPAASRPAGPAYLRRLHPSTLRALPRRGDRAVVPAPRWKRLPVHPPAAARLPRQPSGRPRSRTAVGPLELIARAAALPARDYRWEPSCRFPPSTKECDGSAACEKTSGDASLQIRRKASVASGHVTSVMADTGQ
ncbi:MAG: NACHT domain-containing protein [Egibacteraceae bacterium]